jgi:hypothetical protein
VVQVQGASMHRQGDSSGAVCYAFQP